MLYAEVADADEVGVHPVPLKGTALPDVHWINVQWLLRLRWGAALGQCVVIAITQWGLGIPLPLTWLAAVLGFELLSNGLFIVWFRRPRAVSEGFVGALVALDMGLLTALLVLTGGPLNPFNFLYLVHLALAAVVLRPLWTWSLTAIAAVLFGLLFVVPGPEVLAAARPGLMRWHMPGMWIAFAVASVFTVYFLHRVNSALGQRDFEAREIAMRGERLASLATLAAGAAHELSTPLATIAVVAKELERQLAAGKTPADEDARLIRSQVERCKDILRQMAADAGEWAGEGLETVPLDALVRDALEQLPAPRAVTIGPAPDPPPYVRVPVTAVQQAVRNLVKNALDAGGQNVRVEFGGARGTCWVRVSDTGTGMTEDVLERAEEPFFTTKEPGHGMGLGLFLVRVVMERLGGRLKLQSKAGEGTRATLRFPQWRSDGRGQGSTRWSNPRS